MQAPERYIEAIYTEPQFRAQMEYLLRRRVSRTWLYQLRRDLDGCSQDLTWDYARALAYYAKQRQQRVDPARAKQKTVEFCRSNGL